MTTPKVAGSRARPPRAPPRVRTLGRSEGRRRGLPRLRLGRPLGGAVLALPALCRRGHREEAVAVGLLHCWMAELCSVAEIALMTSSILLFLFYGKSHCTKHCGCTFRLPTSDLVDDANQNQPWKKQKRRFSRVRGQVTFKISWVGSVGSGQEVFKTARRIGSISYLTNTVTSPSSDLTRENP